MDIRFEKLTMLMKGRMAASDADYGGDDEPMSRKIHGEASTVDRSGAFKFSQDYEENRSFDLKAIVNGDKVRNSATSDEEPG